MYHRTLFYNIWGPRHPEAIFDYIDKVRPHIAGLSEVTLNAAADADPETLVHTSTRDDEPASYLNGLDRLLERFEHEYEIVYHTAQLEPWKCQMTGRVLDHIGFGNVLMFKRRLRVLEVSTKTILAHVRTEHTKPRTLMSVVTRDLDGVTVTAHLHGVWIPKNTKGDHPWRNEQSLEVREELRSLRDKHNADRVIFGGDLNLDIDTEALFILEGAGSDMPFVNIVKASGTKDTRTRAYRKYDEPGESRHADYALVWERDSSCDYMLEVRNELEASDHAPLLLVRSALRKGDI